MNNVTNVQCKPDPGTTSNNDSSTSEKTAQTEFLVICRDQLKRRHDIDYVRFTSGIPVPDGILEANKVHETVRYAIEKHFNSDFKF